LREAVSLACPLGGPLRVPPVSHHVGWVYGGRFPAGPRGTPVARGPALALRVGQQILDPRDLSYTPKFGRRLADTERDGYLSCRSTSTEQGCEATRICEGEPVGVDRDRSIPGESFECFADTCEQLPGTLYVEVALDDDGGLGAVVFGLDTERLGLRNTAHLPRRPSAGLAQRRARASPRQRTEHRIPLPHA
jgi:hypothetical protein